MPTTFDGVIGIADRLSPGHRALVVLDKADGGFDLVEKVQTWVAGDWVKVARAPTPDARHLVTPSGAAAGPGPSPRARGAG